MGMAAGLPMLGLLRGKYSVDGSGLMLRLGESGVTMLVKIDHERIGGSPWTVVLSGPVVADRMVIRMDGPNLEDCLVHVILELLHMPGEWGWLEEFI